MGYADYPITHRIYSRAIAEILSDITIRSIMQISCITAAFFLIAVDNSNHPNLKIFLGLLFIGFLLTCWQIKYNVGNYEIFYNKIQNDLKNK